MSTLRPPQDPTEPAGDTSARTELAGRDAANWAKHVGPLSLTNIPDGATNLNVDGRHLAGPLQGFGKLWQKTYRVRLTGLDVAPETVIATWKANYGDFWPDGNNFYAPLAGIEPGEVGLINADMPGGLTLSTGVMVLYADEVSFTYMTPQGHPFAGWITFSSECDKDGTTVAQVEVLMRAQDPASELGLALYGHRVEDRMWEDTLRNLAAHLGSEEPEASTKVVCVDRRRQWKRIGNLRHDAVLHASAHLLSAPVRAVGMSWRGLLIAAAVTNVVAQLGILATILRVIPPLVAAAALTAVGLGVLVRHERVGAWIIGLVAGLQLLTGAPFIAAAVAHPGSPVDFLHATVTVVAATTSIIAVVALLRRRPGAPRRLALTGAAVMTMLVVGSVVTAVAQTSDTLRAGDVEMIAERSLWLPETVTIASGDAIHVDNQDLIRHTFAIEALDLDVELPAARARRIVVDAAPGTYELTCSVPGHERMTGTLVIDR